MKGFARLDPARTVHALVILAVAGAWSGFLALAHLQGRETWLDRLEYSLLDLRFLIVGPRPAPDRVVIVAIDEDAIREAGAYPLPRDVLARLVRTIGKARPSALGIDILLLDPGREEADAALQAALRETDAVIAGAAVFRGDAGLPSHEAERVIRPLARFGPRFGLVNVETDHLGTPRHLPLLIAEKALVLPSFALRLAAVAARGEAVLGDESIRLGTVRSRLDLGSSLPLRFYGPRGSVPTLSAAVFLGDGGVASAGTADAVRGRAVIVGATAPGTGDTFATPYDPVLPGVEVLATGVEHLSAGDGLVRDRTVRKVDVTVVFALALAGAALLVFAPPGLAAGMLALCAVFWLAATVAAFAGGVWLSAVLPLAALVPVAAIGIGGRLVLDRRDARRLAVSEQALRAFHPAAIAARIAHDPHFLAEPMTQAAAIVFVDLSGFTGVSERLGAQRTRAFLTGFHPVVEACIARHGGVVATFMGDGAMCVFGLADPGPEDARRALAAVLELVPEVRGFLAASAAEIGAVDLRVGAHYGEVVVSRLGSASHQHITATGDSVNTASRLMEIGKSLGAALVVSEDLLDAAGVPATAAAGFEGQREVAIRGRARALRVAYRWTRPDPGKTPPSRRA